MTTSTMRRVSLHVNGCSVMASISDDSQHLTFALDGQQYRIPNRQYPKAFTIRPKVATQATTPPAERPTPAPVAKPWCSDLPEECDVAELDIRDLIERRAALISTATPVRDAAMVTRLVAGILACNADLLRRTAKMKAAARH